MRGTITWYYRVDPAALVVSMVVDLFTLPTRCRRDHLQSYMIVARLDRQVASCANRAQPGLGLGQVTADNRCPGCPAGVGSCPEGWLSTCPAAHSSLGTPAALAGWWDGNHSLERGHRPRLVVVACQFKSWWLFSSNNSLCFCIQYNSIDLHHTIHSAPARARQRPCILY